MALNDPDLAQWYLDECHVTAESFNVRNVREYGLGGFGEIADDIIADAIDDGLLPASAANL